MKDISHWNNCHFFVLYSVHIAAYFSISKNFQQTGWHLVWKIEEKTVKLLIILAYTSTLFILWPLWCPNPGSHSIRKEDILSVFLSTLWCSYCSTLFMLWPLWCPPIQAARQGSFILLGKRISWMASCPLCDVLTVLHYLFYDPFDAPNPGSQERLLHSIRKEDILSGFLSTLLWKLILPFHKFANLLLSM